MSEMLPTTKIEVEKGLFLSRVFADHWEEIKQTNKNFIKIDAKLSRDIKRTQSCFGYYPFLPVNINYPLDSHDKLMFPLAQINFSETPILNGYPSHGILQFFISMGDVYGLNFDKPDEQEDFCIRYYENIDNVEIVDDMSFINKVFKVDSGPSPLYDSYKLSFSSQREYAGIYYLWQQKGIAEVMTEWIKEYPEYESELGGEATEIFSSSGHKIGGYPYFSQTDPREHLGKFKDYILLFQMSGDEEIMWGDAGVGNFFIHPDDLAKKDFTKVMYNWDCS